MILFVKQVISFIGSYHRTWILLSFVSVGRVLGVQENFLQFTFVRYFIAGNDAAGDEPDVGQQSGGRAGAADERFGVASPPDGVACAVQVQDSGRRHLDQAAPGGERGAARPAADREIPHGDDGLLL